MERSGQDYQNKTLEVLSTILSGVGIFVLTMWGLGHQSELSPEKLAKSQSLSLAYFVWQMDVEGRLDSDNKATPTQDSGRRLASTSEDQSSDRSKDSIQGTIGLDPWGKAFHYHVSRAHHQLVVWSTGPNGLDESPLEFFKIQGDDIGHSVDLSPSISN